jgi:hypothetical protein
MQQYWAHADIFEGAISNASKWWKNRPIPSDQSPLKPLAIMIHSIVPCTAELERLWLDLSKTKDDCRNRLNTVTLRSLGRLRAHYQEHLRQHGLLKRRKHQHMHTREGGGIDVDAVDSMDEELGNIASSETTAPSQQHQSYIDEQLNNAFAKLVIRGAEDDLVWQEERSSADITRIHAAHAAAVAPNAVFDFCELDKVVSGEAPDAPTDNDQAHQAADDEAGPAVWSLSSLMSSKGL